MGDRTVLAKDPQDAVYTADGAQHTLVGTMADVAASQTDQELVGASVGHEIVVFSVVLQTGATATTFVFNTASDQLSMTFQNAGNGGAVLPHNPKGWFKTVANEALTCTTGAGSTTGVQINTARIPE